MLRPACDRCLLTRCDRFATGHVARNDLAGVGGSLGFAPLRAGARLGAERRGWVRKLRSACSHEMSRRRCGQFATGSVSKAAAIRALARSSEG